MATKKGVWNLQQVRDKQLQSLWDYSSIDPNSLYVWGSNTYGNLGLNDRTARSSPVQIPGTWTKIYPIGSQARKVFFAAKESGTLWSWGYGSDGMLGQNEGNVYKSSPVQVPGTTWNNVEASEHHVLATKTDGTLWVWGDNTRGGLGINLTGPGNKRSSPTQIPGTTWTGDISAVSNYNSFGIKTDGTLWAWGGNSQYGTLGVNNKTNYSSPVQVGSETTWSTINGGGSGMVAGIKTDGTLWMWGRNYAGGLGQNDRTEYSSPRQVPGTTWTSARTGSNATLATKTDGTLWSWGYNLGGVLGQNSQINYSSPVQVPGTTWSEVRNGVQMGYAVKALKTDGTLWMWGYNQSGALGQNSEVKYS
jgi:alpha-tubulin suppressor-like RCC1 family protein